MNTHLKNHLSSLQAAFDVLSEPNSNLNTSSSSREDEQQYRTAYGQVQKYIIDIKAEIGYRDVRWVTARGYLRAWNLLHRAEEAMIVLQSSDEVIREAWHDEMSLQGSGMDSEADSLHKLRTAVIILSPSAAVYLNKTENVTSAMNASNTAGNVGRMEIEARDALRDVRKTLNEYRGRLWEGLVSQRNQLMVTTFITGLFTYFLLLFAIIAGASPMSIEAAAAFYLAGALSGLFIRLYSESRADKAVDDFNLSIARILVTPFISGLAAVGGILLLATLTFTLTQSSNTSISTAIASAFNLRNNGLGLVIATIFGYAPNLFIDALQRRAQDVTTQLQNTTTQSQGTPTPGTPAQLATTPVSLTSSGVVGQPNPQAQPITITNSGGGTLVWQATATTTVGGAWLSIAPATGSISSKQNGSISVTTAVIAGLNPGIYTGTITITGTDSSGTAAAGSPQSIPVTFTVSSPVCTIAAAPLDLTFEGVVGQSNPHAQAITISASGPCANSLNWSAAVATTPPSGPWLNATPATGSVSLSASSTIIVGVSLNGLKANTYTGTVTIIANDSATTKPVGTPQVITIKLHITTPPDLIVSPTSLTLNGTTGKSSKSITIGNSGGLPLNWSAALASDAPSFVSLPVASGSNLTGGANTSTDVIVNATGVPGGQTFTTSVMVSAVDPSTGQATAGSPAAVTITINIAAPAMELSTTGLSFTATQGSNPPSQVITLTNTGGDGLNWTAGTPSATWLTVTPNSGSVNSGASAELTFSVDISGLAPGPNSATVTITPSVGSAATVNVALTVNPGPI